MSEIAFLLEESKHKRTLKFLVSVSFTDFNGLSKQSRAVGGLLLAEPIFKCTCFFFHVDFLPGAYMLSFKIIFGKFAY